MDRPPKPRLTSWLGPKTTNASAPKRFAGDNTTPMLRQLRTKFIALNMALAALVLAASFATICYADYRADIDDVRNRLMAATSRSLHEPQLIPDAAPFHRSEDPREEGENTADATSAEDDASRTSGETGGSANTGGDAEDSAEDGQEATEGGNNPAAETDDQAFENGSAPAPTQDIGAGTSDPGFAPPRMAGRALPRKHRCP